MTISNEASILSDIEDLQLSMLPLLGWPIRRLQDSGHGTQAMTRSGQTSDLLVSTEGHDRLIEHQLIF